MPLSTTKLHLLSCYQIKVVYTYKQGIMDKNIMMMLLKHLLSLDKINVSYPLFYKNVQLRYPVNILSIVITCRKHKKCGLTQFCCSEMHSEAFRSPR